MSGYKRVNFYELCRLCATNQQKDKTHIFTEEGRKIQLQNKIQSCLSLKVCENDFLPKVVCSHCLRCLEECYVFRKECYTSETMLSSYFNNFRYTEDFKKSGKVYIKDTSPKITSGNQVPPESIPCSIQAPINNTFSVSSAVAQENLPYYTIQFPTLVPSATHVSDIKVPASQKTESASKLISNGMSQPQLSLNLNSINFTALKNVIHGNQKTTLSDAVTNVTVNSNGEIIGILPVAELDSLIPQSVTSKQAKCVDINNRLLYNGHKRRKLSENINKSNSDSGIIHIDLTRPKTEADIEFCTSGSMKIDKLPHIKTVQDKIAYAVKIEDTKGMNLNNSVILNQMTELASSVATKSSASQFSNLNDSQSVILNAPSSLNNTMSNMSIVTVNSAPKTSTIASNLNVGCSSDSNLNCASNVGNNAVHNVGLSSSSSMNCCVSNLGPSVSDLNQSMPNLNVPVPGQALSFHDTEAKHVHLSHSSDYSASLVNGGICSVPETTKSNLSNFNTQSNAFNNLNLSSNANHLTIPSNSTSYNASAATSRICNLKSQSCATSNGAVISSNYSALPNITSTSSANLNHASNISPTSNFVTTNFNFVPSASQASHTNATCNVNSMTSLNSSTIVTSTSNTNSLVNPSGSLNTVKIHACEVCQKTFKRREHLYQHVKLHTGFRPFKCEHCNKSFMRKEHLLRHMTSHSGQKNFTCTICEKSFSRNDNLLKHKKTHEKQSSFTCEICQKQFVMKHYYVAHKMTHENEKCSVNPMWSLLKT